MRLIAGYLPFDRAWNRSTQSPLYGPRRVSQYLVFREICHEARYDPRHGNVGVARMTYADLAQVTGLSLTTTKRAARWLAEQGLIRFVSCRPLAIEVVGYGEIGDLRKWLKNQGFRSGDFEAEKSGPKMLPPNNLISLPREAICQKTWTEPEKSGPKVDREMEAARMQNHDEIEQSESETGPKVDRECWLLINVSKETYKNTATSETPPPSPQGGSAPADKQPAPSSGNPSDLKTDRAEGRIDGEAVEAKPSEGQKPKRPRPEASEFDLTIANHWLEGVLIVDEEIAKKTGGKAPKRKVKIGEWAETVRRLREIDGMSEGDIITLTNFRFDDTRFYRESGMGLGRLRLRAANGLRKSDTLLRLARKAEQAEIEREAQRARFLAGYKLISGGQHVPWQGQEVDEEAS